MARRRLLIVSDEMEVGGSQRQICMLLQGLDQSCWQAELVYFRNRSFLVDTLEHAGIRVHHIPKRGRIDPRFLWKLATLLRNGHYDIVHAFSLTAELWTLLARLPLARAPRLVASIRGLYTDQPAWFWRIKRLILRRSDAIISNAPAAADVAARLSGVPRSRFDVIANGVAVPKAVDSIECKSRQERGREFLQPPAGRTAGLFVGRLVTAKNLPCLMRALVRIPVVQRPWIAIVGDGPLRPEIGQRIIEMDLENDMRLLGERSDIPVLMHGADFFVLPSSHEGMPNALMEAMAAGCAPVASRVGGIPELIEDGSSGLLFPSDDAGALATCLLAVSSDPDLRGRLGARARVVIDTGFSAAAMIRATTAIYERCLADHLSTGDACTPLPQPLPQKKS